MNLHRNNTRQKKCVLVLKFRSNSEMQKLNKIISYPASGRLPQVAQFSLNFRGCTGGEKTHTLSQPHTPKMCSIALILLEIESGVIMVVVIWVYIPPPPRPAFSPFLSQFLPETLFPSFKQSTFMYKQPLSHLQQQVQAGGQGSPLAWPAHRANNISNSPASNYSSQLYTPFETWNFFKLARFSVLFYITRSPGIFAVTAANTEYIFT